MPRTSGRYAFYTIMHIMSSFYPKDAKIVAKPLRMLPSTKHTKKLDIPARCTVIDCHLKHDCHLKQMGVMVEVCIDHTKQI